MKKIDSINEKSDLVSIPGLYSTEDIPLKQKVIYEHWVLPSVNFHWLIAELDPKKKLAFGYANLNDDQMAEWGYISIAEIESSGAFSDRAFKPKKFSEAFEEIFESNGGDNQ